MNKKNIVGLSLLLMLCSCNQTHTDTADTNTTTTETSEIVVEPDISMSVKEIERDQIALINIGTGLVCADSPCNFSISFNDKISMWDRLTDILSNKDFDVAYLNRCKNKILEKQSVEVQYGLNYIHDTKGITTTTTVNVDGTDNLFGYYCGVYTCLKTAKYEFTYKEDAKTETFYMWLPQADIITVAAKCYETVDDFYNELDKYYLRELV